MTTAKPTAPQTKKTLKVSDFVTGSVRVTSKVPDDVADLLEDLADALNQEITVKSGQVVPAGQPKFKVVDLDTEEEAKDFKKHALSYSKGVLANDGYSVRLAHISPTSLRVGVGAIVPKPRRLRSAEPDSAVSAESEVES